MNPEVLAAINKLKNNSLMSKANSQRDSFMQYKPTGSKFSVGDMTKFGLNMTPFVGDGIAIEDAKKDYNKGNYGMSAFNAVTALPVIGDIASAAKMSVPAIGALTGLAALMNKGKRSLSNAGKIGRQRGIIGGVNAKTADLEALAKAQDMTGQGIPREQVWNDTGWFKGVDDKWKFEIDDSQSALNLHKTRKGTPISHEMGDLTWKQDRYSVPASELIDHKELFDAYPEKMDRIDFGTAAKGDQGGSYIAGDKSDTIHLNPEMNIRDARSTSLHEMQHALQSKEDFARGGSPKMFKDKSGEVLMLNDAKLMRQMDGNKEMFEMVVGREPTLGAESIYLSNEPYDDIASRYYSLRNKSTPHEQYRALAGEVESRAVETRLNLTPDQRAARPFWMDYDIPESEQIVRFK